MWRVPEGPEGLTAVPVGVGKAWPGFETTRRAKLAARAASGRAGLAVAGDLAVAVVVTGKQWDAGIADTKNRRPEGHRLSVRHGGLEPSTR